MGTLTFSVSMPHTMTRHPLKTPHPRNRPRVDAGHEKFSRSLTEPSMDKRIVGAQKVAAATGSAKRIHEVRAAPKSRVVRSPEDSDAETETEQGRTATVV